MAHLSHAGWRRGLFVLSLLAMLSLALPACSGPKKAHHGVPQPLILVPNTGGDLVQDFSPYNLSANYYGPLGFIYETLLFFNRADGSVHHWLASDYKYSGDAKQVTFTLQQGVKWSDGQAFTSADVKFTFDMLKKYPSIDTNGIDGSIQSVAAPDPQTVVITLTQPSSTILWLIGGQTWIVPQHIWSTAGDPSKYRVPNPVGTGPFVFKSFTPQLITLTKNTNYWQPGKPVVPELRFPAFNGNSSAELAMDTDATDYNGLFVPNVQKTFVNRDPSHNHYYFAPSDPLMFFVNLKRSPFNQLAVRQAINLALDRNQMSTIGEDGYEPPAHPTGLILPDAKQFLSSDYANATLTTDPGQAQQILTGAGYAKGSDGIFAKGGKKLSFVVEVTQGYTDWIADCQIIAANLKAVGIDAKITQVQDELPDLQNGTFDAAIYYGTPGPSPYYIYNQVLNSANSAPIGQSAASNFERWSDPTSDKLLAQFDGSIDPATQQQAMAQLEKIVVTQLPVIFLMNEPYWYQYNTLKYTGWPDQGNLYAEGSPYNFPDSEIIVLNLQPV